MAGFSNAYENRLLEHVVGRTALAAPASLFLALTTVAVAETDTGSTITEPTYTGYGRVELAGSTAWNAASAGQITNASQITFGEVTAGSSTVIGWALCTASSGGDVVLFGTTPSTAVSTTQSPPTIAAGELVLSLD